MKNLIGTVFLTPFNLFGPGKDSQNGENRIARPVARNISSKEAKAMMDSGEPYTLVDVRTAGEFREGFIKGAKLIPVDEVEFRAERELPDKNAVILIYCASGGRSSRASKILANMGYTKVHNFGGIMSWPYGTVNK